MLTCITFVFGASIEFSVANYLDRKWRKEKLLEEEETKKQTKTSSHWKALTTKRILDSSSRRMPYLSPLAPSGLQTPPDFGMPPILPNYGQYNNLDPLYGALLKKLYDNHMKLKKKKSEDPAHRLDMRFRVIYPI